MSQKLYLFVGSVNGETIGKQHRATLDDIKTLMACDIHGTTIDASCWSCLDVEIFLYSLNEDGQAVHVSYEENGDIYISVAVYQELSE